jgi:hypothetical protein
MVAGHEVRHRRQGRVHPRRPARAAGRGGDGGFPQGHRRGAPQALEKYHASRFLETLAALRDVSVALVSRHFEVRLVHQYIESLAKPKNAKLRSFGDEASAIRWLLANSAQSAPPARKSSL